MSTADRGEITHAPVGTADDAASGRGASHAPALGTLRDLWLESGAASRSAVALVHGPAGFGKSSLLRRFVSSIDGPTVMQAVGEPDESTLGYGILSQLLSTVDVVATSPLVAMSDTSTDELDPLLIGGALLEFLDDHNNAAVVITIDDVHLADRPSLRALVFALRRLWRSPVIAVFTCDTGQISRLPESLQRLVRDIGATIELDPFDVADVERIAAQLDKGQITSAGLRRITQFSAGNPLHVDALLRELSVEEINDPTHPLPAPATYAEIISTRLEACSPATVAAIESAAILGEGSPTATVARLADIDDPAAAMDEAVAADMFTADTTGYVGFRHPLTRSAVFHAMTQARRTALHRRAATLLEAVDLVAALDHRVAATSTTDPELADELIHQAHTERNAHAWAMAAERYRLATTVAAPGSAPMHDAILGMVDCLALDGDQQRLVANEQSIGTQPASALRAYALGRIRGMAGDWLGAETRLAEAWRLVDADTAPALAARICGESARTAIVSGRGADALEWLTRAMSYPEAEPSTQNDLMALWALAMGISGQAAGALQAIGAAAEPVGSLSAADVDLLTGRGVLRLWQGEHDSARADLAAVVSATRHTGPIHSYLYASQFLADAAYRTGGWDQAIVTAEDAVDTARDTGDAWALPMLHAVASYPHSARGNFEAAHAHLRSAQDAVVSSADIANRLFVAVAGARLAFARRDFATVIAALEPIVALKDLDGIREPGVQPWQPLLAAAFTETGAVDEACQLLDEVAPIAAQAGLSGVVMTIERERARTLATDDPERALATMDAVADLVESMGTRPFDQARFLLLRGRLQVRTGNTDEARDVLRRAEALFVTLGAAPWMKDTLDELARCGAPAGDDPAHALSPRHGLTAQEARVARLVAQGLTNRQIAAELVVSVKTVGYHLGNVYTKLGVHSRVQMVRALPESSVPSP